MSVHEIVRTHGKPGSGSELADRLWAASRLLTADPECRAVRIYRRVEEPDEFVVVIWTSLDAHGHWRSTPALASYRALLVDLIRVPNEFGHYELVHVTEADG